MKYNTSNNNEEIVLVTDKNWSFIDGEICRVNDFCPMASIENGKLIMTNKIPWFAVVTIECKKFPKPAKGYIYHKTDFQHLWMAFKERKIKQNEEVLIFWSKKYYKGIAKLLTAFMPRLWVMVCPKEAFEIMTDDNFKPELNAEERAHASLPIINWKPSVMR
jgi:hypothetical protein